MELRQLSNFIQVVETGSFVRAAAITDLSQPTLSREIASLEEEFGQRLLIRTGRGVLPTDAGVALMAHARSILDLADRTQEAMRELLTSPRGRISVGLPPRVAEVVARPLVERFREQFPEAMLSVVEGLTTNLREWLIAGRLDIALLFDPQPSPQLDFEVLSREDMMLVVPANLEKDLPRQVDVRELQNFSLLLPAPSNAIRDLIDAATRAVGLRLAPVAEVNTIRTLMTLVESGAGCTILPRSAARHANRAQVRTADIGWPPISNSLILAHAKARPSTRLMREVVTLLKELDFLELDEAFHRASQQHQKADDQLS